MKRVKIVIGVLIIVLVALIIIQNQDYFFAQESLKMDLYVLQYHTPEFPNGTFIIACLLIGFLGAYIIGLPDRFKSKKAIKNLNADVSSHLEKISVLEKELESYKNTAPIVEQPDSTESNA